jgi:hypothetical protein
MTSRALRMLYRDIPAVPCRTGCTDCCGPVPWNPEELARVAADIPPGTQREAFGGATLLVNPHANLRCPFVGPAGCTVYDRRPLLCRTFGTAPAEPRMRCPHGAQPARPLQPAAVRRLTAQYIRMEEPQE